MKHVFDVNNSLSAEFAGFAFYGEQLPQPSPEYHPNTACGYQTYTQIIPDQIASERNYVQMTDMSSYNTQACFDALEGAETMDLSTFERQVKLEFEENAQQQYNCQGGYMSQSLPDIRTYSTEDFQNIDSHQNQYERTKSLSNPPSPNTCSSDGGDSPKITRKSSSTSSSVATRKESSRPRMYKFNPKPLAMNPSMKRTHIASESKNGEYWDKRKKNNEASRRSRLARRLKECMVMEEMKKLKKENEELKAELNKIQNTISVRM